MVLAAAKRLSERDDAVGRRKVGGDRHACAAVGFGQASGGRIADVGLARADVHRGAVGEKARGDHLADPARAAGDQNGLPGDGKELLDGELRHCCCPLVGLLDDEDGDGHSLPCASAAVRRAPEGTGGPAGSVHGRVARPGG